jgi:hypothetical protein
MIDPLLGDPEQGHLFRFWWASRGSYKMVGDPTAYDEPHFSGNARTVEVRAWNLADAIEQLHGLPLGTWFDAEPYTVLLPGEPGHDAAIEAWDGTNHMVTWRDHDGLNWLPEGRRSRRPEDWANIVEAALRQRWELRVVPPEPIKPYPGQEDDGDTD